jgi:hypothetical protein
MADFLRPFARRCRFRGSWLVTTDSLKLFQFQVGSIDVGLAFSFISLLANFACLLIIFYFERHLAEEKSRLLQQTWITTEETRKNAGFESDIDDTEDAEEIQVWTNM